MDIQREVGGYLLAYAALLADHREGLTQGVRMRGLVHGDAMN